MNKQIPTMLAARTFVAARFAAKEKPLSENNQRRHDEELELLAKFIAFLASGSTGEGLTP